MSSNARFNNPTGLAVAEDGTVYVADTGNSSIRAIKDGVARRALHYIDMPQAITDATGITRSESFPYTIYKLIYE